MCRPTQGFVPSLPNWQFDLGELSRNLDNRLFFFVPAMTVEITNIDYRNDQQAADFCNLLNLYASDAMGGGKPIQASTLAELPARIAEFPTAFSLIAYCDRQPAALANCFFGFSTFAGKKLVNIHDLVVHPDHRGKRLSIALLESIEQIARENDCCKLTLEVLDQNGVAMNAYRKFGFEDYELDPDSGRALFWQKKLNREKG